MNAKRQIFEWLIWITATAAVILAAANLYLGDLNQDEGWYLYAAQMVAAGQWPYVDFAFTQGPVMPLVYALFAPAISTGGLAGGRLLTALLGILAAVLAARLAARLVTTELQRYAALITFTLISVNVYQSYFCTVVKTYSLTALLLMLGFLALAEGWTHRRTWLMFMAGAFIALAAGTRSSAGAILPIVLLGLLQSRKHAPPRAWFNFGIGAILAACIVCLPFLVLAPDAFFYCTMQYHTLRHSGGSLMALAFKAGFLSRLLQAYFVAFSIGVGVFVAKLALAGTTAATSTAPGTTPTTTTMAAVTIMRILWTSTIFITLIHFLAPFPYDDYQVFVFPLLAIAVANAAIRLVGQRGALWLTMGILALSLGAAGSSPLNQDWFIQGRDRIWWLVKDRSPLQKLRDTAAQIRQVTHPGDLLLTQDPYLAVEANRKLPRGLEMGQFSYFPDMADDQAKRLHVFNRAGLANFLQATDAPLAALSGYALAIQSPDVTPISSEDQALFNGIVMDRYTPMTNIPCFGQAGTTLTIYRKKNGL